MPFKVDRDDEGRVVKLALAGVLGEDTYFDLASPDDPELLEEAINVAMTEVVAGRKWVKVTVHVIDHGQHGVVDESTEDNSGVS